MDAKWEKKLGISTAPAAFEKDDKNHSRYEPTSYAVLDKLARSGHITRDDVVVDYGCGKGRVGFYLNYIVGCRSIGVEYDENLCAAARENLSSYAGRKNEVEFVCENAENWPVPPEANGFYFFNPFSVKVLRSVLGRIYESYYENPRRMRLFFYYALDEYRTHLLGEQLLQYEGEIDCRDLFHNEDEKEKILLFSIG